MKYIIMGLFSLLAVTTQAQVRGIVKDNTGEPVPGANVFWVNTGQGVMAAFLSPNLRRVTCW